LVEEENRNLDSILEQHRAIYQGTDPIDDALEIYKLEQDYKLINNNSDFQFRNLKTTKEPYSVSDPFEQFGFGIMAYFATMYRLMIILAVISVLVLPIMFVYRDGQAFLNYGININFVYLERIMLGNIG